jgi:hypothetical protein
MSISTAYERLQAAHTRAGEIVNELKTTKTEYHPQQVRGLNKEYIWTVGRIIRLCDEILESDSDDPYGEEVDFRIKLSYFQEHYEDICDKIK